MKIKPLKYILIVDNSYPSLVIFERYKDMDYICTYQTSYNEGDTMELVNYYDIIKNKISEFRSLIYTDDVEVLNLEIGKVKLLNELQK